MFKLILMITLSLTMLFTARSDSKTVGGYTWSYRIVDSGAEIYADPGTCAVSPKPTGHLTIPSAIGEYPVTMIGEWAFYGCGGLTSVLIPDGVVSIGCCAFRDCNELTSVLIPPSVTSIGGQAFEGCGAMKSFVVDGQNLYYQSVDGLLLTKDGSELIAGVNGRVTIPDGVTIIGCNAFEGCSGLTAVMIPSSVRMICYGAFCGCSGLTSVTIPSSVTDIGYSFAGCSGLMSFIVDSQNMYYLSANGLLLSKDGQNLIAGVNGDVVIPSSVTSVGRYAFSHCSGLTSVTIPSSVVSIDEQAFQGCIGLTSVMIPSSVTSIGKCAFGDCSGLAFVTIPSSVTTISYLAFSNCSGLTSVTISDGVTSVGGWAFYGCSGLTSVTIPSSVTGIVDCAFLYCSGLTSVTISSSVTSIGRDVFLGCDSVRDATVPGWKCGINFTAVTNLVISEGTTSIGNSAFRGCRGLTSVTIPSSVTNIADDAFSDCIGICNATVPGWKCKIDFTSVTNLVISEGTTSIGREAFQGCSGLTSVTIPTSVTSIGDSAFEGCSQLNSLTFAGYLPNSIGNIFGYSAETEGDLPSVVVHAKHGADATRYWQGVRILFDVPGSIEETSGTSGATPMTAVSLTVTNVIVHYVMNSKTSDSVIPDTTAGIVNIVAEIDSSKAVAITEDWAAQYPNFASTFDADFSKALTMPTGKKDGAGNAMLVWQDYVAGTDPTKKDDVFTASITFDTNTGKPVISWSPELTAAEAAKREYKKYGKVKLTDEWVEISDATAENYNFFKVSVGMKK